MLWKKRVDLLMIGREGQRHYVLIKILILSCRIILYIVEENIFVVIVYKLSEELLKSHIKDCIEINGKQRDVMPKKLNLYSKIMTKKLFIYNLCRFWKYFSARK